MYQYSFKCIVIMTMRPTAKTTHENWWGFFHFPRFFHLTREREHVDNHYSHKETRQNMFVIKKSCFSLLGLPKTPQPFGSLLWVLLMIKKQQLSLNNNRKLLNHLEISVSAHVTHSADNCMKRKKTQAPAAHGNVIDLSIC